MQSIFENTEFFIGNEDDDLTLSLHGYTAQEKLSESSAIPLPESHIHRTESELDLRENIAQAEFVDQCMFNRLVSGIQKQQKLFYNAETHPRPQQEQRHEHDWSCYPKPHDWCYEIEEEPVTIDDSETPFPQSSSPQFIEDNQRSINNIISTRQQDSVIYDDGHFTHLRRNGINFISDVDDDEETESDSNLGDIFDMEI